jgi:hypothetical protein
VAAEMAVNISGCNYLEEKIFLVHKNISGRIFGFLRLKAPTILGQSLTQFILYLPVQTAKLIVGPMLQSLQNLAIYPEQK